MMFSATSATREPSRAASIRVAPSRDRAMAAAAPMPRLAPVTMITLPDRLPMALNSSFLSRFTGLASERQTGTGSEENNDARIDGVAGARLVGLRQGGTPGGGRRRRCDHQQRTTPRSVHAVGLR